MSIATILEGRANPLSISPGASIREAAEIMSSKRIGFLLVLNDDDSLFGVVSERDIVRDVSAGGDSYNTRAVSGITTTSVQTCSPDDDSHAVFDRMTTGKFRHMPVERDGRIEGVVSMSDLLREFEKESSPEAKTKAFQAFFSGEAIPGA